VKYTDNVRFSHKLNLLIFIGSFLLFTAFQNNWLDNLYRSSLFLVIYAFASAFIQPDLDQSVQRPGKTTFPLGQLKNKKFGEFVFNILYPLNRIWYYFWHPYGMLLTHRGISHWPILGTLTRAGYVILVLKSLKVLIPSINVNEIINYLDLYFPIYDHKFQLPVFSIFWATYLLPVFVSDFIHFVVDLFDSIRNNTRFASYAHDPGLIKQVFNPKYLKFHKRALKKAKSNSKKRK
jgi:uncharacterized metal-binding protein